MVSFISCVYFRDVLGLTTAVLPELRAQDKFINLAGIAKIESSVALDMFSVQANE